MGAQQAGALRAAAGVLDLEAKPGMWLTGFGGRPGSATDLHDPIMARATLLDDGRTSLLIVACDLLGLSAETVAELRLRIAGRTTIPYDHILICCTHTHSGPATASCRADLGYVDRVWLDGAKTRLVAFVESLATRLEPATFATATTVVRDVGHNRQDSQQPFDEELTAIAIDGKNGPLATLVNYATHAVVLGGRNRRLSADFPGAVCAELERLRGGVGVYLQAACGDVNPARYLDPEPTTFDDLDEIGAQLAGPAVGALADAPATGDVRLAVGRTFIDVPVDPLPSKDELIAKAAAVEAERKEAEAKGGAVGSGADCLEQMYADQIVAVETGREPKAIRAEVFAAAVNDFRIVAAPFETYSEVALGVKKGLAPQGAIYVGYANGLFGYLPSDAAKKQGGYGPDSSNQWFAQMPSAVGYGACGRLIEAGVALAKGLRREILTAEVAETAEGDREAVAERSRGTRRPEGRPRGTPSSQHGERRKKRGMPW